MYNISQSQGLAQRLQVGRKCCCCRACACRSGDSGGPNAAVAGSPSLCTLGSTCAGIAITSADLGYLNADSTTINYFPGTKMYVYEEGVVSFGAPLPLTAVVGNISSLGQGDWFAPAFGAATRTSGSCTPTAPEVTDRRRSIASTGALTRGSQTLKALLPDPADPDAAPTIQPLFQLVLNMNVTNGTEDPAGSAISFNYALGGPPLAGSVAAFNYSPFDQDPDLTGPNPDDGQTDFFDLQYSASSPWRRACGRARALCLAYYADGVGGGGRRTTSAPIRGRLT